MGITLENVRLKPDLHLTMTLRALCLLAVLGNVLAMSAARAQEGPGPARPGAPGAAAVSGPEKRYVDMSKSKDRVLKATAERYLALLKFQEWTGASGKTQTAKYVSHDPDLTRVKLAIATGSGKDRVTKEVDVEVAKLNKVCQSRVKQIDLLQKRLEELAAEATKKGETFAPADATTPGAAAPGAEVVAAGPEGPAAPGAQPQAPAEDPSASEPDPLGFAELPPVTPPGAGPMGPM